MKNTIREKRKAAGLTQVQLAKESGYAQANLSHLERGDVNLTVNTAKKLAQALNCKWWELFEE